MRKNITQKGSKSADGRSYIENDWFKNGIPENVVLSEDVYIDTSYGFAAFHSSFPFAMTIGKGSGCYDRASFVAGSKGRIEIGDYSILNGSLFICNENIKVGNHCMFAWGSVITDSWIKVEKLNVEQRRKILQACALDHFRSLPFGETTSPVIIEDNVWVGFDAVIMPGVRLGKGCIVGSKSIVTEDVPAYTIVTGNPLKIIRQLQPDDTEEVKAAAMKECLLRK